MENEREKHILRRKISLFCVGERIRKRRKILLRGRRRTDKEEEESDDRQTHVHTEIPLLDFNLGRAHY